MKIKLLEHYRDANGYLPMGDVADVNPTLAQWLIDNRKAEAVEEESHYGAQSEPEPRNDEVKQEEQTLSTFRSPKRSRRAE